MIDALGGDEPRREMKQFNREKDQTRIAGGLKAYAHFPLSFFYCRGGDVLTVIQSNSEPPKFRSGQERSAGEA